jgi:hypothetical protein
MFYRTAYMHMHPLHIATTDPPRAENVGNLHMLIDYHASVYIQRGPAELVIVDVRRERC